ncbi:methionyl-tRNA formyltransferase [Emticicia aquatilis]|uniref:Methionyl-tRNA formyltransferase n=1 Tax=Emticicia aquatilis TaxID=1537369 RepID=A0A916YJ27_9BACT|nr:methionyl-tRNA formyltransferase [Emticicia aquatilis]GGD46136.1 methionyl-tRNA formyltransferase [Emticicia aquatilis]
MKIVFMGTPDFAVASLKALVESGKEVVAVITAPDKPSGRGLVMNETPVKKYAVSQGIPVLQPEKLKNPEFLEQLRSYQADLQIVVAFRMLPEVVWNMPRLGTFNLHGSLLPQYRGAAPINWAVINGETETGVTTFFLQHEIDTGNVIFAEKTPILPEDNAGTIHDKLMEIGAGLVVKTVEAIEAGSYPQIPQDMSTELKSAPKIFKETCQIDWNLSAEKIHNFVRGLSPYPAAWTTLNDKTCKIYKTEIGETANDSAEIGNFQTDGKTYLDFRSADKWIKIKELQLEGKKRMGIEEFLRGFRA